MRAQSFLTWKSTGTSRAARASSSATVIHQKARAAGRAWVASMAATASRISAIPAMSSALRSQRRKPRSKRARSAFRRLAASAADSGAVSSVRLGGRSERSGKNRSLDATRSVPRAASRSRYTSRNFSGWFGTPLATSSR